MISMMHEMIVNLLLLLMFLSFLPSFLLKIFKEPFGSLLVSLTDMEEEGE